MSTGRLKAMVLLGWVLLLAMVAVTAASIYDLSPLRAAVGVTGCFLAGWALSINRSELGRR